MRSLVLRYNYQNIYSLFSELVFIVSFMFLICLWDCKGVIAGVINASVCSYTKPWRNLAFILYFLLLLKTNKSHPRVYVCVKLELLNISLCLISVLRQTFLLYSKLYSFTAYAVFNLEQVNTTNDVNNLRWYYRCKHDFLWRRPDDLISYWFLMVCLHDIDHLPKIIRNVFHVLL